MCSRLYKENILYCNDIPTNILLKENITAAVVVIKAETTDILPLSCDFTVIQA